MHAWLCCTWETQPGQGRTVSGNEFRNGSQEISVELSVRGRGERGGKA